MELRHLRYFVAVAEELSITRAATRLGIAQPPLSQQIAKLERELGVALLERGARGVSPTAAGAVLLAEARVLLSRAEETVRIVRQAGQGGSGAVRIGCVPSGFSGILLELLPDFRAAYPRVRPLTYELEAAAQLDALTQGAIDIAFLRGTAPRAGVTLVPLFTEPLVAALPEGHRLADRDQVPLTELAGEPFIAFPRAAGPEAYDAITSACHAAGFSPDIVYEASNDHTLVTLVAAGLGVSLVPRCTSNLRIPGITYRPIEPGAPAAVMSAAIPRIQPARAALHLLELARSRYALGQRCTAGTGERRGRVNGGDG